MTAVELKSELYRQIDTMEGNEPLMTKVLTFIYSLGKGSGEVVPYTMGEIHSRITDSLHEIEVGHVLENQLVEQKLLEEFAWLR